MPVPAPEASHPSLCLPRGFAILWWVMLCQGCARAGSVPRGSRVGHPKGGPTGLEGRGIPTLVLLVLCLL